MIEMADNIDIMHAICWLFGVKPFCALKSGNKELHTPVHSTGQHPLSISVKRKFMILLF